MGMADGPYSFGGTTEYIVSLFIDIGQMKKVWKEGMELVFSILALGIHAHVK